MSPALTEIVVRLRVDVAGALHAGAADAPGIAGLAGVLKRFAVELKPQHPRATDAELKSYFSVPNVPIEEAERIASALRGIEAVEAAYVQPPVSPA